MGVYDINPQEYNIKLADALKKIPEIKKAELADFGGLYGALSYARLKYYY